MTLEHAHSVLCGPFARTGSQDCYERRVGINTIGQGGLPGSTRELFIAAKDHKKDAIYVVLPELVAPLLFPSLRRSDLTLLLCFS